MRAIRVVMTLLACVCLAAPALGAEPVDADAAKAFAAECAEKAAAAEKAGTMVVTGRDGWLFLAADLRHVGASKFWGEDAAKASRATTPDAADPLPVILDFKAQLDKAGIELLLVPVPGKSTVYPDRLSDRIKAPADGPAPRVDAADREFFEVLRGKGVAVLDVADDLRANRLAKEGAAFCKQDTHWSGNGCVVAARRIAETIKDREWLKAAVKPVPATEWRTIEIRGDLWRALGQEGLAREQAPLRFVGAKTGDTMTPVAEDRSSPLVLIGDSNCLIYHVGDEMHAVGAGLSDQLTAELGVAIDVVGVRGSGATTARANLFRRGVMNADYLKRKRMVIWCFAAREFTESDGWRKWPLVKEPAAPKPAP